MISDAIDYRLTYCRRKTIGIYVSAERGVEVRVPYFVSRAEAERFVAEKQDWILRKVQEFAAVPARHEPQFQWGSRHYVLGEAQSFHHDEDSQPDILLPGTASDPASRIETRIATWYRQEALCLFEERHQHWCEQLQWMQLPKSWVEVRVMRRRWGSCRRNGKITLNTALFKYPLECVDTVIVHELCHLLEFNHSPKFYRLMTQAMPNWKKWDRLLTDLAQRY